LKLAVILAHPYILAPLLPFSPYLLPRAWKKKEGRKKGESEKEKRNRRKYQDLEGATLLSFLSHGGARLDRFLYYAEVPAKTHEVWVYGSSGAQCLLGDGGPCTPRAYGRICGVRYGVL
jgi:hypothetical protein